MWYCFLTHVAIGTGTDAENYKACSRYRYDGFSHIKKECCSTCAYCAGEESDHEKEYATKHKGWKSGIKKGAKLPEPKKPNRFSEIDIVMP